MELRLVQCVWRRPQTVWTRPSLGAMQLHPHTSVDCVLVALVLVLPARSLQVARPAGPTRARPNGKGLAGRSLRRRRSAWTWRG